MALSKSLPTPSTQELSRVVVSVAVGAPEEAFPAPVAPTAPEPLVPEVSTPVKLITVIEAATLWDRVALTEVLVRVEGAKARQISAAPLCTLVLTTRAHVRPAPEMVLTVVLVPER